MNLNECIQSAVEKGASDIHIQAASPVMLRIGGNICAEEGPSLTNEQVLDFIKSIAVKQDITDFNELFKQGMDFSHALPGIARFRCSAYKNLGHFGMVMRIIREQIPPVETLHLPKVLQDIALSRRGLTLVTGTTGSGKSTTLAAMIDLINQNYACKILTIEDPIEYVHVNNKALITQIEVGIDTPSFAQALRQALRQDPDVILIGEMRDVETLRIALHAADTGHQVFSTVHSANAPQTIERIIAMFPPAEHKLLLSQLAGSIEAIISQRLVTTRKKTRRPVMDILRGNAVTEKNILENNLAALMDYMETGEAGMQTFDQHILKLYNKELISGTEALRWASRPESLAMAMRGITQLIKRN